MRTQAQLHLLPLSTEKDSRHVCPPTCACVPASAHPHVGVHMHQHPVGPTRMPSNALNKSSAHVGCAQ